jgi:Na+/proline symporter
MVITDWDHPRHFIKQFFSGMFITITMTGLDQEMMQKNLSIRHLKDAQKNMFTFSTVNLLLSSCSWCWVLSWSIYAAAQNVHVAMTDDLFPTIAFRYLGPAAGVVFLIGLISAAFPSADGALTSLTTSFSIDFLGLEKKTEMDNVKKTRIRYSVHFSFALIFFICILIFREMNDRAIIDKLFTIAGYTYGPLLGLYTFGLFTTRTVRDHYTPWVAILSPVICYFLSHFSEELFNGYKFGFELLLVNGFLTFMGLLIFSKKGSKTVAEA